MSLCWVGRRSLQGDAMPEEKTETEKGAGEAEGAEKPVEKPAEVPKTSYLIFGKYDASEVVVSDAGLARYINLGSIVVPHTGARHANKQFAKSKVSVVERLINNLMRTEKYTGKKNKAYNAVRDAFEIVATKSKKNPLQILVDAVQNAAPREEVTRLTYAGITVPKAVDVTPSRRVDIAVRNIALGAVQSSKGRGRGIAERLADEILKGARNDMTSFAVARKAEIERVAKSAR